MNPCADTVIDPGVLARVGRTLLDRVIAVYDAAGVALPERRLWASGNQPFDCEQVVVELLTTTQTDVPGFTTAAPMTPCDPLMSAQFSVAVVRCVPVPNARGALPTPEETAAASDIAATDAYLLQKASCQFDMFNAGATDPTAPLGGFQVDASVSVGAVQGKMQAVVLTLTTVVG